MPTFKVPLARPYLDNEDLTEIKKCFDSSWISSKSSWVDSFESEFASKISETKYAVSTNSGTSALFLALKSLGIGRGDEVILPAFTMIATINAVVWAGAKPVLADSDSKQDWNININFLEQKFSKKTKAIIPVHIYGYPCKMSEINALARSNNLFVIEDAAEAIGSAINGQKVGGLGDVGCFSLFSNKVITTGNGGMVTTNNESVYKLLKRLRFFDYNSQNHFLHHIVGYNLVLSGLQAALGLSQIRKFESLLHKKIEIFSWYKELLKDNTHLYFLSENALAQSNYWFPAIIFENSRMLKNTETNLHGIGVETRRFFRPINKQPVYKDLFRNQKYPNAEYYWKRGLLVPSFYEIKKQDVERISEIINVSTSEQ